MKHDESKTQRECVRWFRSRYPKLLIFAIPNGGRRGVIEASIMKGEGVVAGVADLMVLVCSYAEKERLPVHGLFIEMKSEKGKLSPAQKEFKAYCENHDYKYAVCRSFDEFKNEIERYLA